MKPKRSEPRLLNVPTIVGGPFNPKATAEMLLTRVKGLLGEFGQDELDRLGKPKINEMAAEFLGIRKTLLQKTKFRLITLRQNKAEVAKFAKIVNLPVKDAKKIIDHF